MSLYSDIKENVSLHPFNSFHIESKARFYTAIYNLAQFRELIASGILLENTMLLLGGGSNLLFTGNYKGTVVHLLNKGIEIISRSEDTILIKAAAGENWHELVSYCVNEGFGGIENL